MHRAYSVLEIKSVDEDQRIIEGLATTPSTDRMGDIVESAGADFKLPLPFLWQHNSREPIGEVFFAKVEKDGIRIKARIAKIDEPGKLKDRLDEAWQSIKAGLVRGLSIGFQSVESSYIDGTYGMRFLKWLWLELSAVTIPANADASIQTIKSIDAASRPASGVVVVRAFVPSPGASGVPALQAPKDADAMKTIAEQITAFTATRDAKSARMTEIMTKAGEAGATLDATETEEYDGLGVEVKSIDAHLVRLADLEEANKKTAKPVVATTPVEAAIARGAQPVITVKSNLPPGIEFTRMVLCKAASFIEVQKGNFVSAVDIAKARYPEMTRVHEVLKAAVPAATTTDGSYAGPLVYAQNLENEFIEFLRPATIVGKFGSNVNGTPIPSLRRVPFNIRFVGQTSDAEGYWVGQGKPKPLTQFGLEATTLGFAKLATIAVLTQESVRFSSPSAELMARDAIAAAIIKRMDIDFVDPDKAASAGVSPASITNGLTPLSSAGTSADNVRTDLAQLLNTFVDADNPVSGLVLIMPAGLALALSLMVNSLGQDEFPNLTADGGRLRGIPVITSNYVGRFTGHGNIVIAVNPSEIFLSDDGAVTVDVSTEASLEMSDAPTQNGAAGTGASLVSLWQNNLLALRAERFVNWARRRPEAVALMDDVSWGSIGSPSL